MTLRLKKDGSKVSVSYDDASDLDYLPGKTDKKRLDLLTDEEIMVGAITDPDMSPYTDERLAELFENLRRLNAEKYGQGGGWSDPNKRTASK
jgi:hypothetical protein